ncbi:MAG: phosphoglucosamine mutase, partial [Bacteroidales bacterium]|nr:phosphoglucosamine mutase [Bacteroidales bacterium]
MTLIKSISGIRGIIGDGLTPLEIIRFTSAYAAYIKMTSGKSRITIVVGRDARVSGKMVSAMVSSTLMSCSADVTDLGLATTPTVEMAVTDLKADGGIIITASHNPAQWNALKLLNAKGEFLSAADGENILALVDKNEFSYARYMDLGTYQEDHGQLDRHISKILSLPLVNVPAIRQANFRVAFDAVNSVGGIALPALLEALGVHISFPLNANPDGLFAHNPEPLPENLTEISRVVRENKADVGFVVDPDVDRLAIVMEDGGFFGEEYTLVAVADYILAQTPGNTVSNLSSTRALKDVTEKHGGQYFASAVGEVNVVEMMKKHFAIIGGEGNGGVIYPELHFGRDALAGIALFLSHLALSGKSCTGLRKTYPDYYISKNKVTLKPGARPEELFNRIKEIYKDFQVNDSDGLKIEF